MYNYLGILRKSTAIDHCITCNFFDSKTPTLILSKNNRLEFYIFQEEKLTPKKYINVFGKIKILLTIPSKNDKDNIFILSQDLNFCLFSYNFSHNNIDIPITGSIKEDLGKIQDEFLYCLDGNKNYLMICAYKNIFKIICVNTEIKGFDKYKNYTIRFQYEKILFLAPFYFNLQKKNENLDENFLNFVVIKTVYNEKNDTYNENIEFQKDIVMETFQIKIDPDSFNPPYFLNKPNSVSNGKITNIKINSKLRKIINNNSNNNENNLNLNIKNKKTSEEKHTIVYNYEKLMESVNFLECINLEEDQSIDLLITHPNGIIIIFFSTYVIYYQYNSSSKDLHCSKSFSYSKRKFIDYILINEKDYKYYVIDESGNLFTFELLEIKNKVNLNKDTFDISMGLIGKVNPPSDIAYLYNNILFIASKKGNSQLIKINNNIDNKELNLDNIEIIEEYESLAPISNMLILNNTKEENGIEILTVSGVGKNCSIKNIKKGTSILFNGDIDIKNITHVFKIVFNNSLRLTRKKNQANCSFIITTSFKSFILNYDYKFKIISLNKSINFEKNEVVKYAKNIENFILLVSNIHIYIYQNDSNLNLNTKSKINNNHELPLIIKYNKNLKALFIYFNNNKLINYIIDESKGIIIKEEIILENTNISSFDICKKFLVFSMWDDSKIGIYSINNKKINYINSFFNDINYIYISNVQIIKLNDQYNIFLSLSIGKLIHFKLINNINTYEENQEYKNNDFIMKHSYNFNLENFKIKKIKDNNNKYLFLDTSLPCLIHFKNDNIIFSNFNASNCKDIIVLNNLEKKFLFVFSDKISFGTFSTNQNQNIYTLKSGKNINSIKLIDLSSDEFNKRNNNLKQMKYILIIEETELNMNNSLSINTNIILNDMNMKEIAKYSFEYNNEISMNLVEIDNIKSDSYLKKYYIVGTGITDEKKSEPKIGHLYLIEINFGNNFGIKKLQEIELKGGVYALDTYKNIIYVGIKDTLYIYSLNKKNHENFYEFKLIRQISDFDLINNIYVNKNINFKDDEEDESKEKNDNKENEDMIIEKTEEKDINEIFICDLYKTIILFKYDIINDKLKEISRNNNPTWIYNIEQCNKNLTYITDIDNNIITLKKLSKIKNEKEKFKFIQISNFNLGERITALYPTEIKNKNLSELTVSEEIDEFFLENKGIKKSENVNIFFFGTIDGGIGFIVQLEKSVYEFLYFLQELLVKKNNMIRAFDYKVWRSSKDGYNTIESKGFIEGDIIKEFLNYDDDYKKIILKELNYPWKKSVKEVVNIIETLNNLY